jgi:hypothetical protein
MSVNSKETSADGELVQHGGRVYRVHAERCEGTEDRPWVAHIDRMVLIDKRGAFRRFETRAAALTDARSLAATGRDQYGNYRVSSSDGSAKR